MSGAKSAEMFAALCRVLNELHPDDCFSIILFNGGVTEIMPLSTKRHVDFPNCISQYMLLPRSPGGKLEFRCFGCTALWCSVLEGVKKLKCSPKRATNYPHLVVLTDGDDTTSFPREAVEQHLSDFYSTNKKLKVSYVSVDNGQFVNEMKGFADRNPKWVSHFNARGVGDIQECFNQVTRVIHGVIKLEIDISRSSAQ